MHQARSVTKKSKHDRTLRIKYHTLPAATVTIASLLGPAAYAQDVTPEEARAIAKDAYIYGFPIVDNYRVSYAYYTDNSDPNFKAPWNQIANIARVFTPADTAVQNRTG